MVLLILGAIALLLQLQSGVISLPAPKPKADEALAASSAASISSDLTQIPAEPDFAEARRALDAREAARKANASRSFKAADAITHMDFDAAARLLAQWPPAQAAAALSLMPARSSGPILDSADPAASSQWLSLMASPEALPELRPDLARIALDAGWQDEYPAEDLSASSGADGASGDLATPIDGAAGAATNPDDNSNPPPDAGSNPAADPQAPVEGAGSDNSLIG